MILRQVCYDESLVTATMALDVTEMTHASGDYPGLNVGTPRSSPRSRRCPSARYYGSMRMVPLARAVTNGRVG